MMVWCVYGDGLRFTPKSQIHFCVSFSIRSRAWLLCDSHHSQRVYTIRRRIYVMYVHTECNAVYKSAIIRFCRVYDITTKTQPQQRLQFTKRYICTKPSEIINQFSLNKLHYSQRWYCGHVNVYVQYAAIQRDPGILVVSIKCRLCAAVPQRGWMRLPNQYHGPDS